MSFSNVKIHSNIKHKQRHVLTAGEEARKNAGLSALRVGPGLMVIDDWQKSQHPKGPLLDGRLTTIYLRLSPYIPFCDDI